MSGFGTLYQVDDATRFHFSACKSRSDWYKVLGMIEKRDGLPSAELGDTIAVWRQILEHQLGPLYRFLQGEFNSLVDMAESGDPHMFFAGRALVVEASAELSRVSEMSLKQSFSFDTDNFVSQAITSLPEFKRFLIQAAAANRAVVGLWH
jgi:hypothetical protein